MGRLATWSFEQRSSVLTQMVPPLVNVNDLHSCLDGIMVPVIFRIFYQVSAAKYYTVGILGP